MGHRNYKTLPYPENDSCNIATLSQYPKVGYKTRHF